MAPHGCHGLIPGICISSFTCKKDFADVFRLWSLRRGDYPKWPKWAQSNHTTFSKRIIFPGSCQSKTWPGRSTRDVTHKDSDLLSLALTMEEEVSRQTIEQCLGAGNDPLFRASKKTAALVLRSGILPASRRLGNRFFSGAFQKECSAADLLIWFQPGRPVSDFWPRNCEVIDLCCLGSKFVVIYVSSR